MRASALLLACLLLPGLVLAQSRPIEENVTYGYAQVLRASAVYATVAGREPQERRIVAYDVEYQFKGEKYMSRLDHDPGNRLRVRISVVPDAVSGSYR